MPFEFRTMINYRDLNKNWKPRIDAIISYLNESAILHSEMVGFNASYMLKNNCAWILNKFSIQLNDFPKFRDEVRIITWSREIHIIKAYRDFEIYAGQNFIGRASSLWVFTDLKTKKPRRIPVEVKNMYGEEKISCGINPDDINYNTDDLKKSEIREYTIRFTDIDTNGHMNNTAFFNLLENALLEKLGDFIVKSIKICFKNEVTHDKKTLNLGIKHEGENIYKFLFYKSDLIYAYGEAQICI